MGKKVASKKNLKPPYILLSAFVLLIALTSFYIYQKYSSSSSSTTNQAFLTKYTDQIYGIEMTYPSSWELNPSRGIEEQKKFAVDQFGFLSEKTYGMLRTDIVGVLIYTQNERTLEQIKDDYLKSHTYHDPKVPQPSDGVSAVFVGVKKIQVGSKDAYEITSEMPFPDFTQTSREIIIVNDEEYFIITLNYEQNENNQKLFDSILNSTRFLD